MSKQTLGKEDAIPPLNWDKNKTYLSPSGERASIFVGNEWNVYIRQDATAPYIQEAARSYAKQEAIEFAEWQMNNFIEWNGKDGEKYYWKVAGEPLPYNPKTAEELYDLFTQSKHK